MMRTHKGASGDDAGGSGSRGNGNEDLPPPPHPTLAEMMTQLMETQRSMGEVLCGLTQNASHGWGTDQHQGPEPNQFNTFKDFLDTKPPIFKEAEEPLQTDEWLNTIEHKFRLLRLTEHLKTEYASHQLQGPVGIWWSHHRSTLPEDAQITWNQFKATF